MLALMLRAECSEGYQMVSLLVPEILGTACWTSDIVILKQIDIFIHQNWSPLLLHFYILFPSNVDFRLYFILHVLYCSNRHTDLKTTLNQLLYIVTVSNLSLITVVETIHQFGCCVCICKEGGGGGGVRMFGERGVYVNQLERDCYIIITPKLEVKT